MSEEAISLYKQYCSISHQNNTQPIWFDDGFIVNKEPDKTNLARNSGDFKFFSSARVQISKSKIIGSGNLTLVVGFGAIVENLNINIISGDLTLFIGPYSEIKNLVIQSFDSQNYIFFGAANTLNTGNLLIQGERAGIFFGHDCMFSTNFHARTSDSHSIFTYSTRQRINHDSSITVGDHIWVGRQVIFNKGVEINDDVIIGQGSVVNGKLEGASCYAGIPAKKIKDNVTWDRARILNLDEIVNTYVYRPVQQAVSAFLLNDTPFHPYAKDSHSNIRETYKIKKCYPWIPNLEV